MTAKHVILLIKTTIQANAATATIKLPGSRPPSDMLLSQFMNAKHAIKVMHLQDITVMPADDVIIRMAGYRHHSATQVYPNATIAIPVMHLQAIMAACVPTATIPVHGPIIHLVTLACQIVDLATAPPLGTMTGSVHHATILQTGVMPNSSIQMMIPALVVMKKVITGLESVATAISVPQTGPR